MTLNRIVASVWIGVLLAAAWLGGQVYQSRQARPATPYVPKTYWEKEGYLRACNDSDPWWQDLRVVDFDEARLWWRLRALERARQLELPLMPYASD